MEGERQMRDLLDSIAILFMVVLGMLVCVIAIPVGLLLSTVWAPAEGVVNFCRNIFRLWE
jgi:hypothetical protein